MGEWIDGFIRGVKMLFQMGMQEEFVYIGYIGGGDKMFLEVLYRSMTAGGIVLAVLLLRLLMQKMPKIYSYLLWGLVLYRLLCPFTFVSPVSFWEMFDRMEKSPIQSVEGGDLLEVQTGEAPQSKQDVSTGPVSAYAGVGHENIYLSGSIRTVLRAASRGWIAGIAGMLLYGIISLIWLRRRLVGAVKVRDNVYMADYAQTPFVMGMIRPRVYLPSSLKQEEWEYIILHEKTHIRRGDHILRVLAFLALAVYWFCPLVWVAFYLSGKDMEMSCDEAVIRKTRKDIRAEYCASLLHLSTGRRLPGAAPLTFGENGVKRRIENVMGFRKPKPVVVLTALAAVIVAAAILGTDPMPTQAQAKKIWQAADTWAQAVCDRDGNQIAALCTEEKKEEFISEELLNGEEGTYGFGWSSPWPLDAQKDYRITVCSPQQTVILYYAWTSDPHVTVWEESLSWQLTDAGYLVAENHIRYLSNLSEIDNYSRAYGAGINGTPVDYLTNGAGEVLNENARRNKDAGRYYQELFTPQTAARNLLNISEEEEKVAVHETGTRAGGSVTVSIDFLDTRTSVEVRMIQPYGTDGIWIPQDKTD